MRNKLLLFLLLVFVIAGFNNYANAQVNKKDSLALTDLYRFTNGKNWNSNTNWLTAAPVSTWTGITVANNRVIGVFLSFNNLKGILPASIGDLTALRAIDLAFNVISGLIPPTIGKLNKLQDLEIDYNKLIGSIPASITQLSNLESILLAHNQLSGAIPDSIQLLTNLNYINLSYNDISGNIPASFGSLPRLTELNFTHNQLTGNIPSSLGNLTNMFFLDLSFNKLSGMIPPSLGRLKNLFDLYLNNNQLTGNVPRLTALFDINVSHNQLSQKDNIPVAGTTNYTGLDLRYNRFNFNGLEYAAVKLPNALYKFQERLPVHIYNNKLSVTAGGTLSNNTYNWNRVGYAETMVIKGDSTFAPAQSGQYFATISNAIANRLILTTDTVSYTAPLAKKEDKIKLTIYPNPVKNILIINGLDVKSNYTILVDDIGGKTWLHITVRSQSAAKMNVSNLKTGNYLVSITNGNQTTTLQFIKE